MATGADDLAKLQAHLRLLREEYVKLQTKYVDLERKYQRMAAVSEASDDTDNFVQRLLQKVSDLFNNSLYSDITIILDGQQIPAHRFVLMSRSDYWGVPSLADTDQIDMSGTSHDVAFSLVKWCYTDVVTNPPNNSFLLELMRSASRFRLKALFERCEKMTVPTVSVDNCIDLYAVAEEIGAAELKHHCSELIAFHWDDFNEADFASLSAPLLYNLFKSKSIHPLHLAIRMHREDVVFLYLIECDSQLLIKLNELDSHCDLPLDLALRTKQESIAQTLILHKVDVNTKDSNGHSLLHKAIMRGDCFSAEFLIHHSAIVDETSSCDSQTPLHLIATLNQKAMQKSDAASGMMDIARLLFQYGANPNITDINGNSAVHLSIINNNEPVFDLILECPQLRLELMNSNGHSALWLALESMRDDSRSKFSAKLIEKGSSPDAIDKVTGDSLLHRVISAGNENAALFLASQDVKINHTNKNGENPLHIACSMGLAHVATALLLRGANVNQQTNQLNAPGDPPSPFCEDEEKVQIVHRQTPLHIAIQHRYEDCIKAVLHHKALSQRSQDNLLIVPNFNLQDSNDQTALGLALTTNLHHLAKDLILGGANVNTKSKDGLTLLHQAILQQDTKGALFLFDNGVDVSISTSDGTTSLQLAIEQNLPKVVEALCSQDSGIRDVDTRGCPPLWAALERGREEIASILVQHGCDVDCWSPGPDGCEQTLLHRAIDDNNESVACFIIRSGCDINSPRRPGLDAKPGSEAFDNQTPLHLACSWGLENIVATLLEHQANIKAKDSEGKTPIHVAIVNQQERITSLLLSCKSVDLGIRDKKGQTPFTIAVITRNNKAAQAILRIEPRAADQFNNKGLNFLHIAIQKSDIESVLFLLSINVNVNSKVRDVSQLTPLHLAIQAGPEIIVRNLLLAGANVNDLTPQKQTGLHLAAALDHAGICLILLENEINFDALDDNLNNALHIAAQKGHLATIKVLLTESNINAENVNLRGQNPLHVLAQHGKESSALIFEFFMECMPEYPINKPDAEGNTPLLLAYMNGNGTLCRAIVRAGACLGLVNCNGVSIFNYQVATKQLLFRLLDLLPKEPPWSEGDSCLECNAKFGLATRRHHCRHCGRLLCSKCSTKEMPILKYNSSKPVRVCELCSEVLTLGSC